MASSPARRHRRRLPAVDGPADPDRVLRRRDRLAAGLRPDRPAHDVEGRALTSCPRRSSCSRRGAWPRSATASAGRLAARRAAGDRPRPVRGQRRPLRPAASAEPRALAVGDAAEVWAAQLAPATGSITSIPARLLMLDEPGDLADAADFLWRQADERRAELVEAGELPKDWPSTYLPPRDWKRAARRVTDPRADLGVGAARGRRDGLAGRSSGDLFGWREPVLPPGRTARLAEAVERLAVRMAPGSCSPRTRRRGSPRSSTRPATRSPSRTASRSRRRRARSRSSTAASTAGSSAGRTARLRHRPRAVRDRPRPPAAGAPAGRAARHPRAADAGRPRRPHRPRHRALRADAARAAGDGRGARLPRAVVRRGDRIFVPVEQIDRVTRYAGGERTAAVEARRHRVAARQAAGRKAVADLAEELLALYAREARPGPPSRPTRPGSRRWRRRSRTRRRPTSCARRPRSRPTWSAAADGPPRRAATSATARPRSRCAPRSRRSQDGKQVAVLVPTTVLAAQHFETFTQRFAAFPIEVRLLSRFVSARSSRSDLAGLRAARSTSSSARTGCCRRTSAFKDLGLVVVDEEQRFGVAHKERLKQLRTRGRRADAVGDADPADAQPGAGRGPRHERHRDAAGGPAADPDPRRGGVGGLVRDAILRELDRGGQVFFVHNRVETIEAQAEQLRRLLPARGSSSATARWPRARSSR